MQNPKWGGGFTLCSNMSWEAGELSCGSWVLKFQCFRDDWAKFWQWESTSYTLVSMWSTGNRHSSGWREGEFGFVFFPESGVFVLNRKRPCFRVLYRDDSEGMQASTLGTHTICRWQDLGQCDARSHRAFTIRRFASRFWDLCSESSACLLVTSEACL